MAAEESLESSLRGALQDGEAFNKQIIGVLRSPVILGGIRPSEESVLKSTKLRQISQVVGPFLKGINGWDKDTTPKKVAAFLLDEFGPEVLHTWHETHKSPFTEDARVVEVKSAINEAVLEANKKLE